MLLLLFFIFLYASGAEELMNDKPRSAEQRWKKTYQIFQAYSDPVLEQKVFLKISILCISLIYPLIKESM